ncbi:MAG: N-acetyltransferase, partial [Lachnospiraceae bacterium]|nr:N-acetyltransferase [Lachnospiraceae bacterium]
HTEVLPTYGNKGIAKRLVYKIVEEAERQKKAVVPTCSYAAKILE